MYYTAKTDYNRGRNIGQLEVETPSQFAFSNASPASLYTQAPCQAESRYACRACRGAREEWWVAGAISGHGISRHGHALFSRFLGVTSPCDRQAKALHSRPSPPLRYQ